MRLHTLPSWLLAGTLLASPFITEPARANIFDSMGEDVYLGASGNLTWVRHSDMGGGGNLALGYRLDPGEMGALRLEAELGYHNAPGDDGYGDTHYFTYMGNVYYDLSTRIGFSGWEFGPYIGAGLGDATVHTGRSRTGIPGKEHDDTFAWQGMAGITLVSAADPDSKTTTDWTLGYRYLGTSEDNLHGNNIELGVRFRF